MDRVWAESQDGEGNSQIVAVRGERRGVETLEVWGQRYPAIAQNWRRNWQHVTPFFAYPESVRRIDADMRRMVTALDFVAAIDDPSHVRRSRAIGT